MRFAGSPPAGGTVEESRGADCDTSRESRIRLSERGTRTVSITVAVLEAIPVPAS